MIGRILLDCVKVIRKYVRVKTLVLILLGVVIVKKFINDRVKSLSEIEALITSGQLRKVLLGNVLIFVFLKGQPWYRGGISFGSMYPRQPIELYNLANKHKIKQVAGLFPNEGHLIQGAVIGLSFWISFMLVKTITDQNTFQAKRKD